MLTCPFPFQFALQLPYPDNLKVSPDTPGAVGAYSCFNQCFLNTLISA